LHWIDDLKLIDVIATAYYHIRGVNVLERRYFDPGFRMRVVRDGIDIIAGQYVVDATCESRPDALDAINKALGAMGSRHVAIAAQPVN
jgi:hypothetical protein